MVKNPLCNAGDVGSILGQGTKTPYAVEQLSLPLELLSSCSTISESLGHTKDPTGCNKDPSSPNPNYLYTVYLINKCFLNI